MLRFFPLRFERLLTRVPVAVALVAVACFSAIIQGQQNPPAPTATPTPHKAAKPAIAKARSRGATLPTQQPVVPEAPTAPPPPPMPVWPVNERPNPAHVSWDSRGLKIEASNSSLSQILHEVSSDTGATIEGMGTDQRIFGTYGPGSAREVLSRLLDGSGYNVLMIGGEGSVPPKRVLLTLAQPAGSQPQQMVRNPSEEEEEADQPPQPEPPQPQPPQPAPQDAQPSPMRSPFGGIPRIPPPITPRPDPNNPQ